MMRMFLGGALALAALGAVQPARAAEAPWCAVHSFGENGAYWDCRYGTLEQCVPYVIAGNRGFCNPNPAYAGPAPAKRAKIHRHRRTRR
jgi:hypothetical protein